MGFEILVHPGRFGKSTHISMISNSVKHLRSYTNPAIADIAAPSIDVAAPSTEVSASSADIVASNGKCSVMFHDLLSVS